MKLCVWLASILLLLPLGGCQLFYTTSAETSPSSLISEHAVEHIASAERQESAPAPGVSAPAEVPPKPKSVSEPEATLVPLPELPPADFVRVQDYLPNIHVELRYAAEDNFTGQTIYQFTDAYLRAGTVQKLMEVQEALSEEGYNLLIWDAFRPVEAQCKLWEVFPDPVYVANPGKGFSSHSRGNTVDITLVTLAGESVEMPTDFDNFSPLADRDYRDVPEIAAANAVLLETVMSDCGFQPYSGEWWHFSDRDSYPVEEIFIPEQNAK